MSFGLNRVMADPPKGSMPYVAQVNQDGKLKQEIKFFDGLGNKTPDGKFDDNEIYSIMNYSKTSDGKEIAYEYVDEAGDGQADYVNMYEKRGNEYVKLAKIEKSEDMQFETDMSKIKKEGEPPRPTIFNKEKKAYDVQVREGVTARYVDNGDGKLEDKELHVVQVVKKEAVGTIMTEYMDYEPNPDGKCDRVQKYIWDPSAKAWVKFGDPQEAGVGQKMTEIRDGKISS